MKAMKLGIKTFLCVGVALVLAGCEWEAYTSDQSWNEIGYDWVNFSGSYRATQGGLLVVDPSYIPNASGGSGGAGAETNTVDHEMIARGTGTNTTFEGTLDFGGLIPDTLVITAAGFLFIDKGDGTLSEAGGASGTIVYETGKWTLDTHGSAIDKNEPIIAAYQYVDKSSTIEDQAALDAVIADQKGNSGKEIFSMYITQTGNKLAIVDSNGDRYNGVLATISSGTGGAGDNVTGDGGTAMIVAQFYIHGEGAKGGITIEGNMYGSYARAGTAETLTSRTIEGLWVEDSGLVANVNGSASDQESNAGNTGNTTDPNDNPYYYNPWYNWYWWY